MLIVGCEECGASFCAPPENCDSYHMILHDTIIDDDNELALNPSPKRVHFGSTEVPTYPSTGVQYLNAWLAEATELPMTHRTLAYGFAVAPHTLNPKHEIAQGVDRGQQQTQKNIP